MKRSLPSLVLLFGYLATSCAGANQQERVDIKASHLAAEANDTQTELPFWDDPERDHIATEWPVKDDDLKIWDVPHLEKAFVDAAPQARNDGLVVGELGVDGGNRDMIVKLAHEIADGQHGKIDSLLIVHQGTLLFESYYLGGRINLTHPQASATKTYTGLALGRAIQLGYLTIEDLDKPVISFLDELDPTRIVEGSERISLRQALTMRTGIRVSDEQTEEFRDNPDQVQGQALVQALLEKTEPVTTENLNTFSYGNYSSHLVMQVIDAVVPGTAEDFIRNELLGKLDIATYRWLPGMSGLPAGGWKSSMTSRAMAKIGTLAMNKGKWNGEQLISEAYLTEATSRILYTGDDHIFGGGKDVSNQGYGYFWWSGDLKSGDRRYFSTSVQGGGGQFIILIDELDLVVVATGHDRHPSTLQIVAERVIPAFADISTNLERSIADQPKPYEMPNTQVVPIEDSGTDRQYELYIKLPEDYSEKSDARYPVIYTTDAVAHMDMLSGATEYLMPDVILVGISYQKNLKDERPHVSRFRDYSVTPYSNPEHQAKYKGGQAGDHLDFIRDDVIPHIESNYRTDPARRAYFGYSLGGQFGSYILLARPDTFDYYILGSPAFGQRSADYIDALERRTAASHEEMTANVYVSIGELEESELEKIENLVSVLQRRNKAGLRLTGVETIEDADHSSAFPETVVRSVKWFATQVSD